jgi:hypothetical protein
MVPACVDWTVHISFLVCSGCHLSWFSVVTVCFSPGEYLSFMEVAQWCRLPSAGADRRLESGDLSLDWMMLE